MLNNEETFLLRTESAGFTFIGKLDRSSARAFVRTWKRFYGKSWLHEEVLSKVADTAHQWDSISDSTVRLFLYNNSLRFGLGDKKSDMSVYRFGVASWPPFHEAKSLLEEIGTCVLASETLSWTLSYLDDPGLFIVRRLPSSLTTINID